MGCVQFWSEHWFWVCWRVGLLGAEGI